MVDTDNRAAQLFDELASLDPAGRHEVAEGLRKVAATLADARDGRRSGHALGFLAALIDPS
jgi:hypothetical protein